MFYACFTLIGSWDDDKNFRVGIFWNKKLVRVGLQETNNFLFLALGIKHEVTNCLNESCRLGSLNPSNAEASFVKAHGSKYF